MVILFAGRAFVHGAARNSTLDSAIEQAAKNIGAALVQVNGSGANQKPAIAILNFSSPSEELSDYVIEELNLALAASAGNNFIPVDRRRLDEIRKEEKFQRSGEVSSESAQAIGNKLGAGYVVTGTLIDMGDVYRLRIMMLEVETAAIVAPTMLDIPRSDRRLSQLLAAVTQRAKAKAAADKKAAAEKVAANKKVAKEKERRRKEEDKEQKRAERQEDRERFWFDDGKKIWSIGVNTATSFATPWLIGNINVTAAPLSYTFLEIGSDIGFFHGNAGEKEIKDVDYLSYYFYGRLNLYYPIDENSGWYLGAGGGYMQSTYKFPAESKVAPVRVNRAVFDATTGFYAGTNHNLFRIGYSLRVGTYFSNKLYVGYAYRFY
jgi:TolB-like protein